MISMTTAQIAEAPARMMTIMLNLSVSDVLRWQCLPCWHSSLRWHLLHALMVFLPLFAGVPHHGPH